jgi:hypothetical protein
MIDVSEEGGAVKEDPAIQIVVVSGNLKLGTATMLTFKFNRCKNRRAGACKCERLKQQCNTHFQHLQ